MIIPVGRALSAGPAPIRRALSRSRVAAEQAPMSLDRGSLCADRCADLAVQSAEAGLPGAAALAVSPEHLRGPSRVPKLEEARRDLGGGGSDAVAGATYAQSAKRDAGTLGGD